MPSLRTTINHARRWRDFILDIVFPIECLLCRSEGEYLCPACLKKIFTKQVQTCPECHRPSALGRYCPRCKDGKVLIGVLTACDYRDRQVELIIKKLKYSFIRGLAAPLGKLLSSFFLKEAVTSGRFFHKYRPEKVLVLAAPLHRRRRNWRGFNQSEEIARHFAQNLQIAFDRDNLTKTVNSRPQAKLKRDERSQNLKDCFHWQGGPITADCVILIDDITTTGATLNECARTLKQAGAKRVWGLVVGGGQ